MPIAYKKGDLLKSNCNIIAHGCNCFNTMGAGIARQIREIYPKAWEADQKTIRGDKTKLGSFTKALCLRPLDNQPVMVYNLYTQFGFGKAGCNVDYKAIENCFNHLYKEILEIEATNIAIPWASIGIPMIGAGLGGGDWNRIEEIINKIFHNRTIYVYQL